MHNSSDVTSKPWDVLNVEANHHIQHPSVLQRTSGVIFVADKDIILIHVCPDVGFVVIINLITHIQIFQKDVLWGSRIVTIAMSRDTGLVFAYRNALMNWVTDKLFLLLLYW